MNIQAISSSLPVQGNTEAGLVARETRTVAPIQEKPVQETREPVSLEELDSAVSSVREYIKPFNSDLQFSVNDDTKKVVVTVVDSETKEVIRQIPSEEMIAIAKALDSIKGLFVKQQA